MRATLTNAERLALQAHARRALEAIDGQRGAREGECVWHTHPPHWTPADLNALEERGLITVRREWKDNFVRVTDAGYEALASGEDPMSGFVLVDSVARRKGNARWFKRMAGIGPMTTADPQRRAIFATEEAARSHPAMFHPLALFDVVPVPSASGEDR